MKAGVDVRAAVGAVAVVALASLAVACGGAPDPVESEHAREGVLPRSAENPDGTLRTPPELQDLPIGGDFALTADDGQPFRLEDHRGEIFLLFFGYTSCPDFCPATLSKLSQVHALLGEDTDRAKTLFVSIDPERDEPAAMAEYLQFFPIPAVGLTGTTTQIDEVVELYAGMYEISPVESAAGPLFAHSTYVYLIDGAGKVRFVFVHLDTAEYMAEGIRRLLDESG